MRAKRAFWCWLVGFILAFGPLYILGLHGRDAPARPLRAPASAGSRSSSSPASARSSSRSAFVCQIAQLVASIRMRHENRDTTAIRGTAARSSGRPPRRRLRTISPPCLSCMRATPFWAQKQREARASEAHFEDFRCRRIPARASSSRRSSLLLGFGASGTCGGSSRLGLVGAIATLLVRTFDEDTEYIVTASEVVHHEAGLHAMRSHRMNEHLTRTKHFPPKNARRIRRRCSDSGCI